jgi:tetratricopeptide (TPR) repeat protein
MLEWISASSASSADGNGGGDMKRVWENRRTVLDLLRLSLLTILLVGASVGGAIAGQTDDRFAQGNQAYAEGRYDEAISHYEKAIQEGGYSASLLYNMANAFYKKKDVGQAILNYERAVYLDPGSPEIRANLALARKDFGLTSDPLPAWQRPFDRLSLNGWALVLSGAFGVLSFLVLLKGVRPGIFRRTSFLAIAATSLIFALTGGVGAALQYSNLGRGVVTQHQTQLRVSPFDSAASSTSIADGKIVRMAGTYQDYVLVMGENGQSGWIRKEAVQPVIPSGNCG